MVARAASSPAPGHYATDQFNNPYIIPATANARPRDLGADRRPRHGVLSRMGTASSVMGVSDALRPRGVFIQAHEPARSAAISGGDRGRSLIQGWTGLVMPHWDRAKVDHVEPIGDEEALEMTRGCARGGRLRRHLDGRERRRRPPPRRAPRAGAVIVTLAVDTGFKYMSVSPYG
jgi:cysteine synthase